MGGAMEGSILALLERHGSLAYEQIAAHLREPPDRVRNVLADLRERGLIVALGVGAAGDRVATYWSLTDAGRTALAQRRGAGFEEGLRGPPKGSLSNDPYTSRDATSDQLERLRVAQDELLATTAHGIERLDLIKTQLVDLRRLHAESYGIEAEFRRCRELSRVAEVVAYRKGLERHIAAFERLVTLAED
jgi:DNA-binding MarR family transcriptional regulator